MKCSQVLGAEQLRTPARLGRPLRFLPQVLNSDGIRKSVCDEMLGYTRYFTDCRVFSAEGPKTMGEAHTHSIWRLLALLRQNPAHINELAVLWTLPRVSPGAARQGVTPIGPNEDAVRLQHEARKAIREAADNARWAGAILGSSFYVGMAPALAMVYFDQIRAVLRIAAIYGRDPNEPARAAEILVIQGHYRTVKLAEAALRVSTTLSMSRPALTCTERLAVLLHALPSMIGLQLRRMKNPVDVVIGAVEAISFFLPVVSIPVWIYANSRATSRLGKSAISFYTDPLDQVHAGQPRCSWLPDRTRSEEFRDLDDHHLPGPGRARRDRSSGPLFARTSACWQGPGRIGSRGGCRPDHPHDAAVWQLGSRS